MGEAWRGELMRRFLVGLMALAGVGVGALGARADDAAWRSLRGRVVFSDIAPAPADNFPSGEARAAALQRIGRTSIEQTGGFWRIHMVVFLDRPAPTDTLLLRAFDLGVPEARAVRSFQPRQVRVFEVPAERGATELRLDDFVVTEAMGFETGASYEFSVEAPPEEGNPPAAAKKAGKADAYAKGVITLR